MTTTEELSAAVAAFEAQIQAEDATLEALRGAVQECDPRARIPIPTGDLLEPLAPRHTAALKPARPALWGTIRT